MISGRITRKSSSKRLLFFHKAKTGVARICGLTKETENQKLYQRRRPISSAERVGGRYKSPDFPPVMTRVVFTRVSESDRAGRAGRL